MTPPRPAAQPREGVDEEQDRPDLDAGEPRRIGVAADRVDVHAQHRPPRMNQEISTTAKAIQTSQGRPNRVPLPMKAKGSCGLNWVVSPPSRRAKPRTAVSDPRVTMKGGSFAKAMSTPLTRPRTEAREQGGRNAEHAPFGDQGAQDRHHRGGGQDRADRQIDAAGQDDEGHAGREHGVDRGLLHHDRQVLEAQEPAGHELEHDAEDDQHRQHADRLQGGTPCKTALRGFATPHRRLWLRSFARPCAGLIRGCHSAASLTPVAMAMMFSWVTGG